MGGKIYLKMGFNPTPSPSPRPYNQAEGKNFLVEKFHLREVDKIIG